MVRILVYALVFFALAAGFAWLADNPGSVVLSFQDYEIQTNVMVVAIAAVVGLVLLRLVWLVLRAIVRAPRRMRRQMADRRRELGHHALSQGFIAIGSGDRSLASHYAAESRYYLPEEAMTLLLGAQTAQLTGDEMGARAAFESMLARPATRVLGLRGLFLEARRRGDSEAARSFAAAADAEKPGLAWAGSALLEYQAGDQEWTEAQETLRRLTGAGAIDGERSKRLQAVLRVAEAMELEDVDPASARDAALEGHRLAPELVPAAVVASRLLTRLGDPKRAAKAIETTWRIEPHPELAQAYVETRPGEPGKDRLRRIGQLTKIRANHPEGQLATTRAAIDAQDWERAREELQGVLATNPTERACMLMAEIEEGEHGDVGRARDWLNRAVRAPRDPAWVADGYVFDHWEPVSPISGRLDVFEWKVPAERLRPATDHASEPIAPKDITSTALVLSGEAVDKPPEGPTAPDATVVMSPTAGDQPAAESETTGVEPVHQPDDPGPEPEAESEQPAKPAEEAQPGKGRRFRLFQG